MPLSNNTIDTLAGQPYWDDYNRDKRFHRILIRPKYPVQTRELNQMQSMLQNQVERLTTSLYREGQAVVGGEVTYANNVLALQVVRDENIDIANFYNANTGAGGIVRGATSGAEARIVQIARQSAEDYTALIVAPMSSLDFLGDEKVNITIDENTYTMTAAPSAVVTRPAAVFSVRSGTYFLSGHLVEVAQQSIVLSSSSSNPSVRIGFEMFEEIITATEDSSLLDPALNSTNYAAPGAHRLRITATLAARTFDIDNPTLPSQNASENFIEIVRIVNDPPVNWGAQIAELRQLVEQTSNAAGVSIETLRQSSRAALAELNASLNQQIAELPAKILAQVPPPKITEDVLARRTFDESGSYVVRPFRVVAKDHNPAVGLPNGVGTISGNTNSVLIVNATPTFFLSQLTNNMTLLVNGEERDIVSITNDGLLTINSAFTADFSNSAFSFSDPDLMTLELEAGKAYVRGYEFETLGTTKLTIPRARTTQSIDNGSFSTFYGPYAFVTRSNGQFDLTTTQKVDLHAVNFSQITTTNATTYGRSTIGTARVRGQVYATGIGDTSTIYKLYLIGAEFETKTYTVVSFTSSDTALTSVSVDSANKKIILKQNTTAGWTSGQTVFPAANNALNGATLRFYGIYGETLYYDVVASEFANATTTETTLTLTMDAGGLMDRINTSANVVVTFSDKCIRGLATSSALSVGATIANESRVGLVAAGNTVMQGTSQNGTLFRIRESWISPSSIKDEQFETTYQWTGVASASVNATHKSYTVTAPTGTRFPAINSALGYTVFAVTNSSAVVPMNGAGSSTVISTPGYNSATITLPNAGSSVTIVGKLSVDANTALTAVRRTKTFRTGNTTVTAAPVSGNLVSNVIIGQIAINNATALPGNTNFKIVGLGVVDAVTLKKVYAVTKGSALSTGDTLLTNTSVYTDITSRYTLDTGQRSWCYDHAALVLKPGAAHSTATQLLVVLDLFSHTGTSGYFTANSYDVAYGDIPTFTDPSSGKKVSLRDYVDFRPVRQQNLTTANTAYAPYVSASQTFESQNYYPHPDEFFEMDYSYYLGRVDKVVATADKILKVIEGKPSTDPVAPDDPENGMTLYVITHAPYTSNASLVQIESVDHRRYTMRDIGRLEKRIERLEYYTQLSQLEDRTLANPELDEDDIERFKNGMLIEPFVSHAIANVLDNDYQASIDEQNRELRPSFISQGLNIGKWVSESSTNFVRPSPQTDGEGVSFDLGGVQPVLTTGPSRLLLPTYTVKEFIAQPLASKKVNVNPFGVAAWRGRVTLSPATDVWIDTVRAPRVSTNLFDENDNWGTKSFGTVWNDWETIHTGAPQTTTTSSKASFVTTPETWDEGNEPLRGEWVNMVARTGVTTQQTTQQRTGSSISAKTSVRNFDLGDRVIDTAIVPTMREANVTFVAQGLKPSSVLVASFDDVDVTNYVERANEIRLASNTIAQTFIVGETITSNASPNPGQATIVAITGNVLRVANARGRWTGSTEENIHITAALSSLRSRTHTPVPVSEYVSYSGRLQAGALTTLTLDAGASSVTDAYAEQPVYITNGVGEGQKSTITAYNGTTKVATLSPALSVAPDGNSRYSIGFLKADPLTSSAALSLATEMGYNQPTDYSRTPGSVYGMFFLPGYGYSTDTLQRLADGTVTGIVTSNLQFPTGKRIFRISDALSISDSNTIAQGSYEASGQTKTVQGQTVSTIGVNFETVPATAQTRTTSQITGVATNLTLERTGVYWDPLAQTFLVDEATYPAGVFIDSVDLFFARKDAGNVPVTVQIRPTVNGFPSADAFLASVERNQVNVVPAGVTPTHTNANHRTRFTFNNPVYLKGGEEYAIVVLTNSFDYEVFVSEVGQQVIGTNRVISEQPYAGSFFKSQNSRTWTPQQEEDMMFVLNRAKFSTSTSLAVLELAETPTRRPFGGGKLVTTDENNLFEFDVYRIETGHIEFPGTSNKLSYLVKLTDTVSNTYQSTVETRLSQNIRLNRRARINSGNTGSVQLFLQSITDTDAVAPLYDTSRFNFIGVRNVVDDGQLYSGGIKIVNAGQLSSYLTNPYTGTNTVTISITGTMANGASCGSGAIATLYINSLGQVQNVYITSNGSGYLENVTIDPTTSSPLPSWTTNPVFVYNGETSSEQNIPYEQKARYISRRVNLADGFDASDLKVYISACRPPQTSVDVYYKVLGTGDKENFGDKKWVRMMMLPAQENLYSLSDTQFKEYEYRTASNTAAYTVTVNSTSSIEYTRFHTFAVKIVMRTSDTTVVPRVRNLRAIALDV